MMSHGGDGMNCVMNGVMIAALHQTDGQNHSQLAGAEANERFSLMTQRRNERGAERNAGAGEKAYCGGRPDGIYHYAGETIAGGIGAEGLDVLACCILLEERMID